MKTPCGTKKNCEVIKVMRLDTIVCIICVEDGVPKKGYACLFRPDQVAAEEGQRGTLTFTKAPSGDYWRFSSKKGNPDAVREGSQIHA